MTEEVNPEVIKKTQDLLGKYVKKPVLSEKLLKKPPFRFLHDIVVAIIRDTGFLDGLYSKEELQSENVKDKEAKIDFLQKLISAVKLTTGKEISARPNKIIAGYEPTKTNELLQIIGKALQRKLNSEQAVLQVKVSKSKSQSQKKSQVSKEKNEKKEKVTNKGDTEKKIEDRLKKTSLTVKKHKSDSPHNQSNVQDKKALKDKHDLNVKKHNSKDKITTEKRKEKESSEKKKEKNVEKKVVKTEKKEKEQSVIHMTVNDNSNNLDELKESKKTLMRQGTFTNEDKKETEISISPLISRSSEKEVNNEPLPLAKVKVISNNESVEDNLMGELTSQDPIEEVKVNDATQISENSKSASIKKKNIENTVSTLKITESDFDPVSFHIPDDIKKNISNIGLITDINDKLQLNNESNAHIDQLNMINKNTDLEDKQINSNHKEDEKPQEMETKVIKISSSRPRSSLRPPSVRPSSARPGAPRVKDRSEVIVPVEQIVPMGKINVIVENFDKVQEDDDENESLVIVESTPILQELKMEPSNILDIEQESKGHLVAQILKTQKELTDEAKTAMPVEIEWEAESQRNHETKKRDIEGLRTKIQMLTRVALPLGQIINFLQEDYDNIMQEFKIWRNINEKLGQEIKQEKMKAKEVLQPLKIQIEEIEKEIEKQKEQNNIAKAEILYNQQKIEKMFTTII